ncbi:hypothetical protein P8C59_001090 [Phyllachora maydis]|uniref:Glucosamine 6-phosphate N-acetyltransferase n=1 Tax=Phyllachora maydis TaxID=1825666 RepID=A0AAD9HXH8_9PEZI|nr:hypothetical protein P8C59_001090 [Phyllachora maydis]
MSEDPDLFPAALISAQVQSELPDGYTLRPLRKSDYDAGFLDTLGVLTTVGDFSRAAFDERFDYMRKHEGTYYILVVEERKAGAGRAAVVGCGTVIVERKFIHQLGKVGHIEEIAVAKSQQGKKLGLRIIHALDHIAHAVGCYKTILDCSEANEGFYVKCGYRRAGLEMAHYYPAPAAPASGPPL